MKILITIALTALALGTSILSIKCYIAFFLKHRVDSSSSILHVSMFLTVFSLCFIFGVFFPIGIVGVLDYHFHYPAAYGNVSEVVWLVASFSYAVSRLRRGFIRRN
jgi:hypothetical protein